MTDFDPNASATQGELLAMAKLLIEQKRTIDALIGWLEGIHQIKLRQRLELCRQAERDELAEAQACWDAHVAECKANGIDPNTGELFTK
jgi:hypothetical protein